MNVELWHTIERLHGLIAWIATAALVLAAWRRRAGVSAIAASLAVAAAGLGLGLDDGYRGRIRQRLFVQSASLGWLFERKLHVAFGAVVLAVGAAAALMALRLVEARGGGPALARDLRRSAAIAAVGSAILAIAAAVMSAIVTSRAGT